MKKSFKFQDLTPKTKDVTLNGIVSLILLPGLGNALINSSVKNTEGEFLINKYISVIMFIVEQK